jgi:glycosyltransferase involved in cell wall biosynthesis
VKPLRVLVVSDVSSYMRGGVPTETRCLLRGLGERGIDAAFASDAPLAGVGNTDHLPIELPVAARTAVALEHHLGTYKPQVVHVISMSAPGVARIAPLLQGRPWALTIHSVPPHERKLALAHGSEALHYGLRALRFLPNSLMWRRMLSGRPARQLIVHSRYVRDAVVAYGARPQDVSVIPLPVAAAHASPAWVDRPAVAPGEPATVVTVGGLAHTKGQHDVLAAWPDVLRRHPGSIYVAIGEVRDPSYLAHLREIGRRAGFGDSVRWLLDCSDEEKALWLHRADLYVQPSHEEGFCLAYAEATRVVSRLIGADTGAIADLSRDQPGMRTVPPRDPRALAQGMLELLATAAEARALARRSADLSIRFGEPAYLDAHLELYDGLIAG